MHQAWDSEEFGRSRGGLTTKIHAVVDANGLPLHIAITGGQQHDSLAARALLEGLPSDNIVLADKAYDATEIRTFVSSCGGWANIPPRRNRRDPICFSPYLYRQRNHVERFFNRIKQCRRIATRYEKPPSISLHSSSSQQSGYGCAFMSPRPSLAHRWSVSGVGQGSINW